MPLNLPNEASSDQDQLTELLDLAYFIEYKIKPELVAGEPLESSEPLFPDEVDGVYAVNLNDRYFDVESIPIEELDTVRNKTNFLLFKQDTKLADIQIILPMFRHALYNNVSLYDIKHPFEASWSLTSMRKLLNDGIDNPIYRKELMSIPISIETFDVNIDRFKKIALNYVPAIMAQHAYKGEDTDNRLIISMWESISTSLLGEPLTDFVTLRKIRTMVDY